MFKAVLIANRGAIATRIERTLDQLGVQSVAVFADDDRESLHVRGASKAVNLGVGSLRDTYLDQQKIIAIASAEGAQAIHPGYGFLSENPDFVRACEKAGLIFLGPTPEQMEIFGLKHRAREIAEQSQVPLLPGSSVLKDLEEALTSAALIGYPVMLKSTAGGGGIGMSLCRSADELIEAYDRTKRLSGNNFANDALFLEKFVERARHIEVQVFGDGQGRVIALGERDCSAQRRNQKVIEEAPAPGLTDTQRQELQDTAVRLMESVNYRNAGTVEFIFDVDTQEFYFLEVNTRLQVEHGVTEAIFGVDLVEWMLLLGAGELPPLVDLADQLQATGHAVQARLYAENPLKNFQPSTGLMTQVEFAVEAGLRIDHWIEAGVEISPNYDPMLAKIIAWAPTRDLAVAKLSRALDHSRIYGIETNQQYLLALSKSQIFHEAGIVTASLAAFRPTAALVEVLDGGTQTTIQDYPGRSGFWHVGIPPSGPFDDYSFRLGNRLLGNPEGTAGLECTLNGPRLQFHRAARLLLAGAAISADIDGRAVAMWEPVDIEAGATLSLGAISGPGCRTYMLISGGLDCPDYLGSKSTFTLGQFGGHAGRALRPGDFLHLGDTLTQPETGAAILPDLQHQWQVRVIPGPQGAPDYFTERDIDTIFSATWEVHFNSSRTGVRLIGPKPEWARSDGGEAGLHPSNIHDNAYAVGTLDFTGDMPILLGPDGPSLGGFVCPATVIAADRWKLGQLRAGDKLHFVPVSKVTALAIENQQDRTIRGQAPSGTDEPIAAEVDAPVLFSSREHPTGISIRAAGEKYLLVEFGDQVLDIVLRCRIQALYELLLAQTEPAILEMTPGIRSLQVHYDNRSLNADQMVAKIRQADAQLGDLSDFRCPSRIIYLPLSWNDEVCDLAAQKYSQTVRKNAPWCPSNIEFIRRINGMESVGAVRELIFAASYLVMGLGDVYLGAPVATPIDPRHRLVTTKYNPARTWTAENSVGIGGSYLCIYGMEGPGGYQLFGRTLQMWNRYRQTPAFQQPWLLRFFDQIRFYPVSADELQSIRRAFPLGEYQPRIEETEFVLADYLSFLEDNRDSIQRFTETRSTAFAEELDRWIASGQMNFASQDLVPPVANELEIPPDCQPVYASISGAVWKLTRQPGDKVQIGDILLVAESMKMEIALPAPMTGELVEFRVEAGAAIRPGQVVALVRPTPQRHLLMIDQFTLSVSGLLGHYRRGDFAPRELLTRQLELTQKFNENPAWIARLSLEQLEPYLQRLEANNPEDLPLYGVPFAIKDNIDLAGVLTTAGCPDFAYTPERSATVVQRLIDAGAVPLGKTNMDQFATGLVGTRSPYGACHSVFSADHISGGSSSGSAVAVAASLVAFALGTDTAGSGRVPAAFNNLVGLKPSRGLLSNTGMVRACRSLDCISIFARDASDARQVFDQARGADAEDEYSRAMHYAPLSTRITPRVAVPLDNQLEFFGDASAAQSHQEVVEKLRAAGWELVATDFSVFFEAARLLYQGPWVAERQASFGEFAAANPEAVLPLLHQILAPGDKFSAAEVFEFQYRLQALKVESERILAEFNFALTPTAPTHYRIDQITADPIALNSNLGTYTNFMNLLDLSAVAVPAGFTENNLPWGITLFARAFHDYQLLGYAEQLPGMLSTHHKQLGLEPQVVIAGVERMELAVCGAHMSGLPLNYQLVERDGVLLEKTITAKGYRLFALSGEPPRRPGLMRDLDAPTQIELEVWSLPTYALGSLLTLIPAPLGLGKVELADGRWITSFICEPWGIETGEDISRLGSWRGYLKQQA